MTLPNLAGVATSDLVETKAGGKYSADYINWSRTLQLLREHAPGWLPCLAYAADDTCVHRAPTGAFLLIAFVHLDGRKTPHWPQAIMDHRNQSIPYDKVTARDVTDTHRRGVCAAAAGFFGLGYELWAKMPLENPHRDEVAVPQKKPPRDIAPKVIDEAWLRRALTAMVGTLEPSGYEDAAEKTKAKIFEAHGRTKRATKLNSHLQTGMLGLRMIARGEVPADVLEGAAKASWNAVCEIAPALREKEMEVANAK